MIGYPFDSKVEYDSEGKPSFDRAITSEPLRKLYDKLFSTGVMPNPSDNFQVIAGDAGMTVKVNPGFAVVKGCLKLEETTRTIEIQAASSSLDRIDTVVLRLNDEVNARICDLYVRQGIPATSPTRPDLVRSGSVYEIGLADIFIPQNTSTITQKRITDTRLDPDRCGYVSSISKFDTQTLYLQIQSDLADFKSNEQEEFLEWFEYIKGQLSEDVAGNLQNQIGVLSFLKTEIKTNLVNAINWLKEKLDELVLKIGTKDISNIGDGSVTGAISALNSNLKKKRGKVVISYDNISKQIGKAGLPYTCTEDCLMVVSRFACASTNEVFICVNNLNIISSNSSSVYFGFTMPLNAGDVVSVNNTNYIHSNTRFSFYKEE